MEVLCSIFQLNPPPDYIQSRIAMYDRLKTEYDKMIAGESGLIVRGTCLNLAPPPPPSSMWATAKERTPIKVTLPDGSIVEGKAWQTTPYDIAVGIR